MSSKFQLLINGKSLEGSEGVAVDVINPATGESIGKVAYGSPADIEEAIETARRGLRSWQAVPAWERGRILKDAAGIIRHDTDRIAQMLTLEQGKILAQARDEVYRAADFIEWGGEQARRIAGRIIPGRQAGQRIEVQPHPIGVVAALTPWNFPMALAAKKFAGALAAGCAIICKPSQETPGCVLALGEALLEAGVHPAALTVVFGDANQVSTQLIESSVISKITFTGSIPIGKRLAAAAGLRMKPVTMELGGHAPVVVCSDVDPEATAELLARAKFTNAGQICLCPSRFFVEESIAERFAARFAEVAGNLKVGDGMDPATEVGPLANERRVEAIARLVDDARDRGARILAGGNRVGNHGYFYTPTVLTNVSDEAALLHEEPFGPVAPILPFRDEEAMLDAANGLEFGLSAYVFTHDGKRQRRLVDALQYGAVSVNSSLTHLPEAPLGGWKDSGIGTEGGIEILEPYTITKHVNIV
ncbi:NAD-dependent succinate-semialdehyde dehydrogenase [Rhizobium johnstonii]|uniref:NAD-dependent succinate-semialdehyde dehydrogenase n=1 Tax=Rhizobium TaxID=379 RepID=UPI0010316686|nr:NAD-dependent succinate-semialdehyde dehydrogenase [Rhizobium leguminosarum]TBF70794.1 NAD-dependent succinate-semialdehyde dehydrogenase [Rhizobium leguminosarum]TBG93336.1 NAD-dependent succinate-semialdehyde dehydrogenase [Rhizobium leguminosarum]TBG94078.1 NAD-dependent succinate-semialdehyde dehydrogenase [Rhizobium leguminosarum]TBH29950.1 NAD-dependent succinate-semialdehyde dehydrogenase [Rhizobium leguminosarum]TBH50181.1 NAD-dependent succinate-semialdehyde dehydrogenase [Rhizobiu